MNILIAILCVVILLVIIDLRQLIFKLGAKMARAIELIRGDISDLNVATNELAVVVDSLRDKIKEDMTPEEVEEVRTAITGISARSRALAADPDAVVPENPPLPVV